MNLNRCLIALSFLALTPLASLGQISSGPEAGAKVEPLKVEVGTGDKAGQEVDYLADRGAKPTVYIFVRADTFARPVAAYLREMDKELAKGVAGAEDAVSVAIWLTEDVAKSKQYVPVAQNSLKLEKTTFAVYPGDKSGPNGWSINSQAHVTAVVVRDGKVVGSFGYISVNATDVPEVVAKLAKKADK